MFLRIRESLPDGSVVGLYIVAMAMGAWEAGRHGFLIGAALCALPAFVAWILGFKRLKTMEGTPTSRIASAAQGYVELAAKGISPPNFRVVSKLTGLPCLWYRYIIHEKTSDNKWKTLDSGRSDEPFLLEDDGAVCLVDPEGAEMLPQRQETWTQGQYRYTEWLLLPGKKIYAIGEFCTRGGNNLQLDEKFDISELLAEWKRDRPTLLQRFDLDRDGEIGEKEWMLARAQARRDIRKQHVALRAQPGTHMLQKPADGRLFLITDRNPEKLQWRYRFWTWIHLLMFLLTTGFAAQLLHEL